MTNAFHATAHAYADGHAGGRTRETTHSPYHELSDGRFQPLPTNTRSTASAAAAKLPTLSSRRPTTPKSQGLEYTTTNHESGPAVRMPKLNESRNMTTNEQPSYRKSHGHSFYHQFTFDCSHVPFAFFSRSRQPYAARRFDGMAHICQRVRTRQLTVAFCGVAQ